MYTEVPMHTTAAQAKENAKRHRAPSRVPTFAVETFLICWVSAKKRLNGTVHFGLWHSRFVTHLLSYETHDSLSNSTKNAQHSKHHLTSNTKWAWFINGVARLSHCTALHIKIGPHFVSIKCWCRFNLFGTEKSQTNLAPRKSSLCCWSCEQQLDITAPCKGLYRLPWSMNRLRERRIGGRFRAKI